MRISTNSGCIWLTRDLTGGALKEARAPVERNRLKPPSTDHGHWALQVSFKFFARFRGQSAVISSDQSTWRLCRSSSISR